MKVAFLILLPILIASCTWYQVLRTTAEIVEVYPQDNILEEKVEEHLEEYFGIDEGSIDLTPFSPE